MPHIDSPLTTLRTLCRITLRNDFPPDLTIYFTLTEKAAVIYDRDCGLAEMLLEMKAEE